MAAGKTSSRQVVPRSSAAARKSNLASGPRHSAPSQHGTSTPEACLARGDVIAAWTTFERVLTSLEIEGAADISAQLRYARDAGNALQEFGEDRGNREALVAAAALFRRALSYGIDIGVTQLNLGNVLIRLAYQENSAALTKEAQALFEQAIAELPESSNYAAFTRATLNHLETRYLLGRYTADLTTINDCVRDLEILISQLPDTESIASPDLARAEAVLGHALVARHGLSQNHLASDLATALNAYRRAIKWSNDLSARARVELDFATALVENGEYSSAIETVTRSLQALSPEKYTMGWANAQTVLADARRMLAASIYSSQPEIAHDHLVAAIGSYEEILGADQEWPPVIRGGTKTRLAGALVLLWSLDHPATGEYPLRRAIDLYNDAIPDSAVGDHIGLREAKDSVNNLLNQLRRRTLQDSEYENIVKHITDARSIFSPLNAFVESKAIDYTQTMNRTAIIHAAAQLLSRVYPAERVGKALEDLESAATETSVGTTAEPRPKWPDDALPYEINSPPHFAARAYRAEAEAGTLHRGLIGQEDRARGTKLASTLSNWLRTHPWPTDVPYIPTKPEWVTRRLEAATKEGKPLRAPRSDEAKLRDAARYRAGKPRPFS